jgi:hypothetical protein
MLAKRISSIHQLAAGVLLASLVGCATPGGAHGPGQGHRGQLEDARPPEVSSTSTGTPAPGGMMDACPMMGSGKTDSACGMHMNKEAMCSMYRSMRDAPDEQARQAMMDRHLQGMPPEARRRHMEMLRQQCE